MSGNIKQLFKGYLLQLETIVNKVPPDLFSESLADDMFSLEMNAKIAVSKGDFDGLHAYPADFSFVSS